MHAVNEEQPTKKRERFVAKYLDPASRLGEILFGLIMVLTVTLAAGVTIKDEGREGVRELLLAAFGCNIAWGIIDAVLFLMNCVTVRAGKRRLVEAVRRASSPDAALSLVQDEVDPELQELLSPEDSRAFTQSVLGYLGRANTQTSLLTRKDWYGALACFWLVFLACLPAVLPFLIFSQLRFALRVSNFLLIVLLFLAGHKWGKYAGTNPLRSGMAMVAVGLVLVAVAIMLGG